MQEILLGYGIILKMVGYFSCVQEHNIPRSKYLMFHSHCRLFIEVSGKLLITSLAKEVMFLVALVSLSVCLFVCLWTLLKKL